MKDKKAVESKLDRLIECDISIEEFERESKNQNCFITFSMKSSNKMRYWNSLDTTCIDCSSAAISTIFLSPSAALVQLARKNDRAVFCVMRSDYHAVQAPANALDSDSDWPKNRIS